MLEISDVYATDTIVSVICDITMLNTENGLYVWKYWYFLITCHKPSVSKDHFSSSE